MISSRFLFSMTLILSTDKVLIAGGGSADGSIALTAAELFDPLYGTFTATGPMGTGRIDMGSTLLNGGSKVLIVGGRDIYGNGLATAEVYDSATGTFSPTAGPMSTPRIAPMVTLLPGGNGKVLVAGGETVGGVGALASAELYDPVAGTFSPTGSMLTPGTWRNATLLPSGQVLVVGGLNNLIALSEAELYTVQTSSSSGATAGTVVNSYTEGHVTRSVH
jgi:hypothetical protein